MTRPAVLDAGTGETVRAAVPRASAGVPFSRIVHVELRKQVDTRAGRWLVAGAVGLNVGLTTVMLFFAAPEELTWQGLTAVASIGWALLLPLVGVLAATGEWSQRTALTTFVLEPRRTRVVLAKLVATCALGLGVLVLTLAAAAVLNVVGAQWSGGDGSWAFAGTSLLTITIELLVLVVMGLAFGLLLGRTSAAVIAYLALPTLWTAATTLVPALRSSAAWLDLNRSLTGMDPHQSVQWAQLATSVSLWVVLPLLLGVARTRRREVS